MVPAKRFQDVEIWRISHQWVVDIYRRTAGFPREELFGLTSQLRRAAVSIPANFAEGFRKKGIADKLRYYNISQGSISESMYYLVLIQDLGLGDMSGPVQTLTRIDVMLNAYVRAIENSRGSTAKR